MTKYCNFFLNNKKCTNVNCQYIHYIADKKDTYRYKSVNSGKKLLKIDKEKLLKNISHNWKYLDHILSQTINYQNVFEISFPPLRMVKMFVNYYNKLQGINTDWEN